jgi:hypothetical protein
VQNKFRTPWDSFPGPLNEGRTASTAGGGTALTTSAVIIGLPNGTKHVSALGRNPLAGANVVKIALNPYIAILRTDNSLQSVVDSSVNGQQNPAVVGAISLNNFDVFANGGALYIGSHMLIRGIRVVMSANVNSNASVLTGNFWNGTNWTALAGFSDGTSAAGATFAQSGDITWTVPGDTLVRLSDSEVLPSQFPVGWGYQPGGNNPVIPVSPSEKQVLIPGYNEKARHWFQFTVSAKLSASVQANTFFSMNRNTTQYSEYLFNTVLQYSVSKKIDGIAAVEALTDVGTGNLIVNVYTDNPAGAF